MWHGSVILISVAPGAAAPMRAVEQVRAVAGRGLEDDRYFSESGTYSRKPGPDREVTLIEVEAIEGWSASMASRSIRASRGAIS